MSAIFDEAPAPYRVLPGGKDAMEDGPARTEPTGFTQLRNAAVLHPKLSLAAKGLLLIVRQHRNEQTGECFPAYERLRELCGADGHKCSPSALQGWLRSLAEAGELAWVKDGRSNHYLFPGDPGFEDARQAVLLAQPRSLPKRRSPVPADPETTTPTVVIPETTTPTVEQHYDFSSAALLSEKSNKTNLTRRTEQDDSAATQRDAPAAPSVPARANPEPTNAQANDATPSKPKRSTASKASDNASEQEQGARRAPRPPTNAIQRVEQGIKAAGVKVVVNFGKDGKRLADLLAANPEVATDDVIACYVAIAQGEYGDDYMRRRLSITAVCAPECIGGYLNWRSQPRAAPRRAGRPLAPGELSLDDLKRIGWGEGAN